MAVLAFVGILSGVASVFVGLYALWTTLPVVWALAVTLGSTAYLLNAICKWVDPE